MKRLLSVIIGLVCVASVEAALHLSAILPDSARSVVPDTISTHTAVATLDTTGVSSIPAERAGHGSNWWIDRIRNHTYNIQDTSIQYPRFVGFCVKVYNWGDRFFNTYDTTYVQGTGTKWKAMVKFNNWTDSYAMSLGKMQIRMLSNVYSNVGPYISFMAVSIGYEANLNRLVSHLTARQKRWEFNFSTSLFWVNAYYTTNKDGTVIRRFGNYRDPEGHTWINQPFPRLNLRKYGLDIYYFFNHKRYSQGAAYSFSKYQRRSQGSLLLGLSMSHQYIDMDFSCLPSTMLAFFPTGAPMHYNFTYNDYCLLLGYGYNFVPSRHWLLNITALPNVGMKHCMPQTSGGRRELFSLNVKGQGAVVYNLGHIFAGLFTGIDLHWYSASRISFANALFTFGAQAGYRF